MSGTINVVQRTQRLVVDIPTRSVFVISAGPVGPPGMTTDIQARFDEQESLIALLSTRIAELEVRVTQLEA